MTRVTVYSFPSSDDYTQDTVLGGWFDTSTAESWSDRDRDHDGNGSHGPGRGEAVWRTADGRWALEKWTDEPNEEGTFRFISEGLARTWLLTFEFGAAVAKYFGEVDEEHGLRRPDRAKVDGEAFADTVLLSGGTITLGYDPGESGACDEDGIVIHDPVPGGFYAIARDAAGSEIGSGGGMSAAEALGRLRHIAPFTGDPSGDEPPF
ncbi:hypothetical protein GFY24_39090 [Nocardia sp. SYP-A9097]|uniref:hypothetical protein n=1 Tax=Nocardia sp. SYP-A9097 TaxID=2663237 RepID=UPI00129ADD6D|nr:hypothetical protein [Nocardia sp. SYP-A9097]MRH93356.1 hypothetical protein [Nocardia sp. SYP-A9097]